MLPAPSLRRIREQRFITQEELAQQTQVSRATISRIERGEPARLTTLRKLAQVLGIQPADLTAVEPSDEGQREAA